MAHAGTMPAVSEAVQQQVTGASTQAAVQPQAAPAAQQPAGAQTNVHVHLPPDLLRMAGMQQPAAQPQQPQQPTQTPVVAQPAQQAAQEPAKPAEPAAKPAQQEQPAAKPAVDPQTAELAAKLAALEDRHRATLIRAEVDRVSAVGGAIDPAVVHQLVAGDLDVTADGKVIAKGDPRTTGEQHIARFLASKPFLLKPQVPGGGAGTPGALQAPAGQRVDFSNNDSVTNFARQRASQMGFRRQ